MAAKPKKQPRAAAAIKRGRPRRATWKIIFNSQLRFQFVNMFLNLHLFVWLRLFMAHLPLFFNDFGTPWMSGKKIRTPLIKFFFISRLLFDKRNSVFFCTSLALATALSSTDLSGDTKNVLQLKYRDKVQEMLSWVLQEKSHSLENRRCYPQHRRQ